MHFGNDRVAHRFFLQLELFNDDGIYFCFEFVQELAFQNRVGVFQITHLHHGHFLVVVVLFGAVKLVLCIKRETGVRKRRLRIKIAQSVVHEFSCFQHVVDGLRRVDFFNRFINDAAYLFGVRSFIRNFRNFHSLHKYSFARKRALPLNCSTRL